MAKDLNNIIGSQNFPKLLESKPLNVALISVLNGDDFEHMHQAFHCPISKKIIVSDSERMFYMYSIDLKIVSFPCERDFYFFEIIRLVIFVEPFNSSQKARIHTFSSSESWV